MRDIADWFRYKLVKKLRKRYARIDAAAVRAALRHAMRGAVGSWR